MHCLKEHTQPRALTFLRHFFLLCSIGEHGVLRYQARDPDSPRKRPNSSALLHPPTATALQAAALSRGHTDALLRATGHVDRDDRRPAPHEARQLRGALAQPLQQCRARRAPQRHRHDVEPNNGAHTRHTYPPTPLHPTCRCCCVPCECVVSGGLARPVGACMRRLLPPRAIFAEGGSSPRSGADGFLHNERANRVSRSSGCCATGDRSAPWPRTSPGATSSPPAPTARREGNERSICTHP